MAIDITKQLFRQNFCKALSLKRVSALPLLIAAQAAIRSGDEK